MNRYNIAKASALMIQKHVRGLIARRQYKRLRRTLPKYAVLPIQRAWRRHHARTWLHAVEEAVRAAGDSWRTCQWPDTLKGKAAKNVDGIVRTWYKRIMAKRYRRGLIAERRAYLAWKATASELFQKKASYGDSFLKVYVPDHIALGNPVMKSRWESISKGETAQVNGEKWNH